MKKIYYLVHRKKNHAIIQEEEEEKIKKIETCLIRRTHSVKEVNNKKIFEKLDRREGGEIINFINKIKYVISFIRWCYCVLILYYLRT